MSKVKIDYSEINNAAKKARSAAGYYEDFADELERKVSQKLTGLSGSDSHGNVGSARSILSAKIRELRDQQSYFSTLAVNVESLADKIEEHERSVVSSMKNIATNALELGNQSPWETFCQWMYGTFCVDLLNWNPITRCIGNSVKRALDWVQEQGTKIVDYFMHGEGRYIVGIVFDTLKVVAAIAGTVVAVAAAVATGGAAIPLVIAAVASVIGTSMTAVDAIFSIGNKVKAIKTEREGDPGLARYYGNTGGFSDTIRRTDMGGQAENAAWEAGAAAFDVVHVAADVTAFVSGGIGQAGLYGTKIKNPATGKPELIVNYDKTLIKTNLKNTMMEKLGLRNVNGEWTFRWENLFSTKRPTGTIPRANIFKEDLLGDTLGQHVYTGIKNIQKIAGYPGRIYSNITNIGGVISPGSTISERIESGLQCIGNIPVNITSPINDLNKTIFKLVDAVTGMAS